uniref:Maspardin n=1 Tax=Anthurium amnicola TaxID=1678845 RepID=A0A1D1YAL2_9ARAE
MKSSPSAPGDYVHFRSLVPLHKISGYRVVSVDIPRVWNHHEWIQAFEKFLDAINTHHVHLYGTSLGGFLAQLFAQHRPRRVKSLVLSNSFLDTHKFSAAMPWSPIVNWTPSFLLKRYILSGIHDGPHEPFIADSVDFVVGQIETLSREDLSSRLTLNATPASVGSLLLSDSLITLMDTNDYCAVPQQLKDQVSERYPGARRAILKSGGDFPFLSRPDEVNLYLQLHLRRVGVEAKPDLAPGVSHDGGEGSSSNEKSREDLDDPPADSGGAGTRDEGTQQQSLGSESHGFDEQLLHSAKTLIVDELLHHHARALFVLVVLQFYASPLSMTWKPQLKV